MLPRRDRSWKDVIRYRSKHRMRRVFHDYKQRQSYWYKFHNKKK